MVHSMAHLNIHHNHQLTHIDSPSSLAQLDHSLYSSTNSTISSMPQQMQQRYPQHPNDSFYTPTQPTIDVDALAAGVQRFIPGPTSSNSFIALTAGMDPSTVDFRTFYPYNPSEVKHRKRTTRSQLKILEDTFKRETKPNAALRKSLAAELEMTPRGVQVWFQNRRAKEKALAKKAGSGDKKSINAETDDQDHEDDHPSPINDSSQSNEATPPAGQQQQQNQTSPSASPEPSPEPSQAPQPAPDATATTTPPAVVADLVESPKLGPSPSGLGVSRMSWQGPASDATKRVPTLDVPAVDEDSIVNLRRPSLPVNLGHSVGLGLGGPPNSFRMRPSGFDPSQRRMSLDRLATHPYAHVAVAANGAVYGQMRPHRRLPIGQLSQSSLHTPQAMRSELPQTMGVADSSERIRPELMHRGSMPPQGMHMSRSTDYSGSSLCPDSLIPPYRHMYATVSSRHYQPPSAGPLPAPGYSFGTSTSAPTPSENDNDQSGASSTMQGYPLKPDQEFDGDEESPDLFRMSMGPRFGSIASIASESSVASGYYSENGSFDIRPSTSHSLHGQDQYNLDARRPSYTGQMLDMFSHLDVHNGSKPSLHDTTQLIPQAVMESANGTVGENSGVHTVEGAAQANGTNGFPSPSSTVSGRGNDTPQSFNEIIPISKASELAFALKQDEPETNNQQGVVYDRVTDITSADPNGSRSDSDTASFSNSHRSSCSSGSSLMYPLSASSSKSSLVRHPHLALDIGHSLTDKFVADDMDFVSMTGHYSPISHPSSAFDFPPSRPISMHLGVAGHMQSAMQQHVAPMGSMYSASGLGDADFAKVSDGKDFLIGAHDPMHMGLQINLGEDIINKQVDAVGNYAGYYN